MRSLFTAILLLLYSGIAISQSIDSTAAADAVRILIEDREFENAIARVEAALKKDRNNADLLLLRGLVLVKLGRLDDAAKHYRKIRRKVKKNPEPLNNLAMVYRMQGKYKDAIDKFRETIGLYPDYIRAYENLGDTYVEIAKNEYQRGLEKQPDSVILKSKVQLGEGFNQLAIDNTPEAKRLALAKEKKRLENAQPPQSGLPAEQEDQIVNTLGSWITYWSERDVDNFLSHYSSEYVPQNSVSLEDWVQLKSAAIDQAEFIRIKLDEIAITRTGPIEVTASFTQFYESDRRTNRSIKSLVLKRYGERWLITREESRTIN